jgi:hypothetical protein
VGTKYFNIVPSHDEKIEFRMWQNNMHEHCDVAFIFVRSTVRNRSRKVRDILGHFLISAAVGEYGFLRHLRLFPGEQMIPAAFFLCMLDFYGRIIRGEHGWRRLSRKMSIHTNSRMGGLVADLRCGTIDEVLIE